MNNTGSNHPKREVPAASTLSMLGTSRDLLSEVEIASAVTPQPTMQLMSGALGAPDPMESGDGQIKSSGGKSRDKETKVMSKLVLNGGNTPRKKMVTTPTSRTAIVAKAVGHQTRHNHISKPDRAKSDAIKLHFAKTILEPASTSFCYRWRSDADGMDTEIVCKSALRAMQVRCAATRLFMVDDISRKSTSSGQTLEIIIATQSSSEDYSEKAFKVIFEFLDAKPQSITNDLIFSKLGIPSAPKLLRLLPSEVYRLIEDVLELDNSTIHAQTYSDYSELFGNSDQSLILSDLCSAAFQDIGDINVPPMTLNEFGNVLHSLQNFGEEVGLATLNQIFEDI